MTKHTSFWRGCSLRVPKSPGLLDCVPWEDEETPWTGSSSLSSSQEGALQEAARNKSSCRRQATSLQAMNLKIKDKNATLAGEASDRQLLIGEVHGKAQADSRMKQCQKVNRALQCGWESFLTNVYRLVLIRSASLPTSRQ